MMHPLKYQQEEMVLPISATSGQAKTRYDQDLTISQYGKGHRGFSIFLLLIFCSLPFISCNPFLHLLNTFGIYAIVALGLNVLSGYTGQISLVHGALFGIGAYSASILETRAGIPFFLSIPAAGLFTAGVGTALAFAAARFKRVYILVATLAGQFMIDYVLVHWTSLTGGLDGLKTPVFIPNPDVGSMTVLFYIIFICFGAMLWFSANLLRTKTGRAFMAIGQNERTAALMGITVFSHKVLAFTISSFYAGIAGALFAAINPVIIPSDFDLTLSVKFLAICFIGGMATLSGAILGAFFMACLEKIYILCAAFFPGSGMQNSLPLLKTPVFDIVLGVTIVLFIIFLPDGLARIWRAFQTACRLWPFSLKQH